MDKKNATRQAKMIAATAAKSGIHIPHTAALNILAGLSGFENRNALAAAEKKQEKTESILAIETSCGMKKDSWTFSEILGENEGYPKSLSIRTTKDLIQILSGKKMDLAETARLKNKALASDKLCFWRIRIPFSKNETAETKVTLSIAATAGGVTALALEALGQTTTGLIEKPNACSENTVQIKKLITSLHDSDLEIHLEKITVTDREKDFRSESFLSPACKKNKRKTRVFNQDLPGIENDLAPSPDDYVIFHSNGAGDCGFHHLYSCAPYIVEAEKYLKDYLSLGGYETIGSYSVTTKSGKFCLALCQEYMTPGDITQNHNENICEEIEDIIKIAKTYLPETTRVLISSDVSESPNPEFGKENPKTSSRVFVHILIPFDDLSSFFSADTWESSAEHFYNYEPDSLEKRAWSAITTSMDPKKKFLTTKAVDFNEAEEIFEDLLKESSGDVIWSYPTPSEARLRHIHMLENSDSGLS